MARPRFEAATGAIDGVNKIFLVTKPYDPGSLAVFLNGQLKRRDFNDGWEETSPTTGVFTMKEAPLPDDVVQAFYLDSTCSDYVVEQIKNLTARIRPQVKIAGQYRTRISIKGSYRTTARLYGKILHVSR